MLHVAMLLHSKPMFSLLPDLNSILINFHSSSHGYRVMTKQWLLSFDIRVARLPFSLLYKYKRNISLSYRIVHSFFHPLFLHTINMSDFGRQDISSKISNAVKPDSEKSTPEHFKDKVAGSVDNAVGHATPKSDKTVLQKASDAVFGDSK